MKQLFSAQRSLSHSSSRVRSDANSSSAPSAFEGMDENEIVARIMQEVRRCESSARRSLHRPPELSYRLDKNGSIVSNHRALHPSRPAELYSVDDANPIPTYHVELTMDRVGSLTSEMNDTFEYLMTGTPRRNVPTRQSSRRRAASTSVAPRYLSSDSESYVEQYDVVGYKADEMDLRHSERAGTRSRSPPCPVAALQTPQYTDEADINRTPSSMKSKRILQIDVGRLDKSTSSHSSSSSNITPLPSSPTSDEDEIHGAAIQTAPSRASKLASSSSVITVAPPVVSSSLLCSGVSSWLGDAGTCQSRAVKKQMAPAVSVPTDEKMPTSYETMSRPFRGPSSASEALESSPGEGGSNHMGSGRGESDGCDSRSPGLARRGGGSMLSYLSEEDDVDVMRPWFGPINRQSQRRSTSGLSSVRSNASSVITTLETIRERSNDANEPSASPRSALGRQDSYASSRRRHLPPQYPGERSHYRVDSNITMASRSSAGRRTASSGYPSDGETEYDHDDENTTLYYAPSETGAMKGGCMAIVRGVLSGIDEAERAFLGDDDDDDLWTDLYDDDYDLYSTEASSHRMRDRSLATDRSYSTKGRSVGSNTSSLRSRGRSYVA